MKNITRDKMGKYFIDVFGANTLAGIDYVGPRTYRGDAYMDEERFVKLCQKLKAKGYRFSAQKCTRMIKFGFVPEWYEIKHQGWLMHYPSED
jgi:hypothetical protein